MKIAIKDLIAIKWICTKPRDLRSGWRPRSRKRLRSGECVFHHEIYDLDGDRDQGRHCNQVDVYPTTQSTIASKGVHEVNQVVQGHDSRFGSTGKDIIRSRMIDLMFNRVQYSWKYTSRFLLRVRLLATRRQESCIRWSSNIPLLFIQRARTLKTNP